MREHAPREGGVELDADPQRGRSAGRTDQPAVLLVAEAAELIGVPASRLRQWETHGLVTPSRTSSGYRTYTAHDLRDLRRIRDLFESGLNTEGVRRALTSTPDVAAAPLTGQLSLGGRLRTARLRKSLSLRELATVAGTSASHLSAIERGLTHPSVAVLQRIAAQLDSSIIGLLGDPSAGTGPIVRVHERRALDSGDFQGVEIRQLYGVDTALESLLFIVAPSGGSESYTHKGEEFLYMLEGSLEVVLDERETYQIGAGDAMTFASHRPHRFRNNGTVPASLIWVNTPPTF